ncbi:MAG: hypothetical protein R2741_05240 [Methanolobus sp.]
MKYIHFVIVLICLLAVGIYPASALETEAMIHYSEPAVNAGDEITLEQGYSMKISDLNSKSGDVMLKLYLNGEEVDLDDNFASDDDPMEYVRTVTDDDDDEMEYLVLRVTPKGTVKESGGDYYSTIYIEQYLDPVENIDDYLILDESYSFESDRGLELADIYEIEVTGTEDNKLLMELILNDDVVVMDEVGEDEYFYYTTYKGNQPNAVLLARVKAYIEGDDSITVFLDQVSVKQISKSRDDGDVPDDIDIEVASPVAGGLKAGRVAIITYDLDEAFTEVRILVDGEFLDSRNDVSKGSYKAVTDELDAGIHTVMLIMIDGEAFSYYSEDFSVSVNIKDNISGSISEMADSAVDSISGKANVSVNTTENSSDDVPEESGSEKSGSGFSNVVSLLVTAGVFVVFFVFYNKFR